MRDDDGAGLGPATPGDHQVRTPALAAGAVGLVGVLFMAVANAAPITAMSFNVPIAVGYGNGLSAPAGFLFATVVLTIFAIGFVTMSRHITTAGAFYGFVSHGLGQIWGMAVGLLATVAYVIFEASLVGGFSYFAADTLAAWGLEVNWLPIALVGIAVIAVLTYYKVTLSAVVLGVTLVCEIILLLLLAFSVLFRGGGPDGLLLSDTLSLSGAFSGLDENAFGTGVAAGAAALGLFFAFWSWVGFETTAAYGEESRNPTRIIPRATLYAVVGLGLFYTFVSAMVVAGQGRARALELSSGAAPVDLWLTLVDANLGAAMVEVYRVLLVVGSFACAMAFHNAASRYIFALGRESASQLLRRTVGRANSTHGSPANASFVQTGITVVLVLFFFFFTVVESEGASTPELVPYVNVYGLLAIIGTAMILVVQTLCSVAVIWYFWVRKVHPGHVLSTLVAPGVGAVGMIAVIGMLWSNREFAAGLASDSWIFTLLPLWVLGTLAIGVGYALWLRSAQPGRYAEIGRTTFEEAREREPV
ncbi:MAG: APC family permease [Dermatophilaceae bacterium]